MELRLLWNLITIKFVSATYIDGAMDGFIIGYVLASVMSIIMFLLGRKEQKKFDSQNIVVKISADTTAFDRDIKRAIMALDKLPPLQEKINRGLE